MSTGRGPSGPRYEAFLRAAEPWRDEIAELRRIVLECGLTEEVKWGAPCFTTADGGNVAIIGVLNDLCCLSFFKGVLLTDPEGILRAPGENSRSARLIPFTSVDQILAREGTLKAYVEEAAANERAGARVDFAADREDIAIPAELQARLDEDPAFSAAFAALTPGRRRGWILHVAGAKQSSTRASRVAKAAPRILAGKGMHDR